jgi:transposase
MAPRKKPPPGPTPSPKTVLSDSEIMRILSLSRTGLTSPVIAKEVGRGQSTVSRILRVYDYNTFDGRVITRICKRKTSKHEDRILLRTAKAHDDQCFRDIITLSGINVSRTTLRRRLKEVDLYSRVRRRKPVLKPHHARARLLWAIEHVDWTRDQWMRVIWSDESTVVLGRKSRRRRCIRRKGDAYKKRHCDGTVKSGKISIMVWACFSGTKVGPMIVCDAGNVNADRYIEILENGVMSFIEDLLTPCKGSDTIKVAMPDAYLFMHDNAPCHKANKVTNYLRKRRVRTMKWPAQSPDLNPIENLWTMFKDAFHKELVQEGIKPSTRPEVMKRCGELMKAVWRDQGMELIDKLIESMRRRCVAVIAAGGWYTKY